MTARPYFLPLVLLAAISLVMLAAGPIPQLDNYHAFADQRAFGGIERAADVLSNLGFLAVGVYGLWWCYRASRYAAMDAVRPAYTLFFGAVLLTAFGSAWYHVAPDDARLIFDRLPIALACAGLLGAAAIRHLDMERWIVTPLASFAVVSVCWWALSGDLRLYLLLQAAPLVAIPVLLFACQARAGEKRAYGWAIGLYIAAKAAELADHAIYAVAPVSGHTLKHLLAAAAAFAIARHFASLVPVGGVQR